MSSKSNGASAGAPAPPVDYLDLSSVTPLLTAHTLDEKPYSPFQMGGPLRLASAAAQRSGHLVAKVSNLGYWYGDKVLIKDFSTQIMRGDKIGIIGPNGSGKTTLLRLLLGKLEPLQGKVRLGTNLEISYYDQLREQLDEEKTVIENVGGGSEIIDFNGKPRHIIGYLQNFLFSPQRARTPVKVLSGGERNRILLARLFTKPSNVLVMDEPTNDLDIETLELLEELLLDYSGTLLLVSHDRAFLNNVATSTMVMEGDGVVHEYPGGYDDWLSQSKQRIKVEQEKEDSAVDEPQENVKKEKPTRRKLSFKEEKELAALTIKIETLEKKQDELYTLMSDLEFFKKTPAQISEAKAQLEEVEEQLLEAFQRWEVLEDTRDKSS